MGFLLKAQSFFFQNRTPRQTIAKNAFWLSLGQLGSRLLRASIIIYAARVLGAAEYGLFSYALGLAGFFTVFADIGVGQIMTRESAKNPESRSYYFSTTFWIKLILLIFAGVFIIIFIPRLSNVNRVEALLPFIALLVFFDGLRDFSLSFFRALEKMEREAIVTVFTNLIIVVSGFIVFTFSANAKTFMIAYAASVAAGAIIAITILRKEFYKIFNYARITLVKPIIYSALPIAFSSTLGAFMLNTDLLMLGWWQSAEQIGYYSAGQKIAQVLFTLPAIIASAIFPTLARLIGEGAREKVTMLMQKSLLLAFLLALPATLGGIILGSQIIVLIYGATYMPAILNFQILMVTVLLNFPGVLIGNAAIAYDRQKQITKYLLIAALGNALLDAILIPRYGIVGSTIATIIALTIDIGLCWSLLKKITGFTIFPHIGKIVLSSLLMGGVTFALYRIGFPVLPNIILSGAVYFGILLLLKEKVLGEFTFILRAFS